MLSHLYFSRRFWRNSRHRFTYGKSFASNIIPITLAPYHYWNFVLLARTAENTRRSYWVAQPLVT